MKSASAARTSSAAYTIRLAATRDASSPGKAVRRSARGECRLSARRGAEPALQKTGKPICGSRTVGALHQAGQLRSVSSPLFGASLDRTGPDISPASQKIRVKSLPTTALVRVRVRHPEGDRKDSTIRDPARRNPSWSVMRVSSSRGGLTRMVSGPDLADIPVCQGPVVSGAARYFVPPGDRR